MEYLQKNLMIIQMTSTNNVLTSEKEYDDAIKVMGILFDVIGQDKHPLENIFLELADLIEAYEAIHYPL